MKLKKYENKELRKSKIISFVLACVCIIFVGLFVYQSYANYQMKATFKLINGKLKMSGGSGDIEFAFYNGAQKLDTMPTKDNEEGLVFIKAECNNGTTIKWNYEDWDNIVVNNLKKTKTSCSLYFGSKANNICTYAGEESGACYLAKKSDNDKINIEYDTTKDINFRYIGTNPNNYINFNNDVYQSDIYYGFSNSTTATDYRIFTTYDACIKDSNYKYRCQKVHSEGDSMWRIIGVMNNITQVSEDGQNKETNGTYIKIIRDKFDINYSWDSSLSGINGGEGVNEWSTSDIEKVLNDEYLYRRTGTNKCYKDSKDYTTGCPDWPNIGIKDEARNIIVNVKWNTGTMSNVYSGSGEQIPVKYMYETERSENNGKKCSSTSSYCTDSESRYTTWTGKIGLMYPSDYGYAIGTEVRELCLGKTMNQYDNNNNCMTYDWLYDANNYQWTMTPAPTSSSDSNVFYVNYTGFVGVNYAYNAYAIRPVVYLKSDVKIVDKDYSDYGSINHPFELEY